MPLPEVPNNTENNMTVDEQEIKKAIIGMAAKAASELLALDEDALAATWFWRWDKNESVEHNTCEFSDDLDAYKRRCRGWEEHHNGCGCVVERVRDKYLIPKVEEFLEELAAHKALVSPTIIYQAIEIKRLRSALLTVNTWDVGNAYKAIAETGAVSFALPEAVRRQVQDALGSEN
jgi:hypothetical protein